MGLMQFVKREATPLLDLLIDDSDLKETILYKKYSGSSFDNAQGHNVDTFTDFPGIDCIKSFHTEKSAKIFSSKSGLSSISSSIQEGDELYVFKYGDLPSGRSLKDQIIGEDGSIYRIKTFLPVAQICVIVSVDGG